MPLKRRFTSDSSEPEPVTVTRRRIILSESPEAESSTVKDKTQSPAAQLKADPGEVRLIGQLNRRVRWPVGDPVSFKQARAIADKNRKSSDSILRDSATIFDFLTNHIPGRKRWPMKRKLHKLTLTTPGKQLTYRDGFCLTSSIRIRLDGMMREGTLTQRTGIPVLFFRYLNKKQEKIEEKENVMELEIYLNGDESILVSSNERKTGNADDRNASVVSDSDQDAVDLTEELEETAGQAAMARQQAAEEVKQKAAKEARKKVAEEAKQQAAEEAKQKAAEEARKQAAEEAKRKATEEAKQKAAGEARKKVAEEAEQRAAEQARKKAAEEARQKAAEETRQKAAEEARQKAAEEARQKAAEEARQKAAEESRQKAAEEAIHQAAEKARQRVAEVARRKEAEEVRQKTELEARQKAAEESRQQAAEEARRKAAEEATQKAAKEAAQEARQKAAQEAMEKAAREKSEIITIPDEEPTRQLQRIHWQKGEHPTQPKPAPKTLADPVLKDVRASQLMSLAYKHSMVEAAHRARLAADTRRAFGELMAEMGFATEYATVKAKLLRLHEMIGRQEHEAAQQLRREG